MPPQDLPRTIGRYEVIDRLGHGGMGDVFRCRDPRIGAAVAIKLLRISDEGLRERFLQEARAVGILRNHRNIVNIYDYGEHEGQPFLVMEFVEGVTLAEQIRGHFQLSLPRKLELIEELCTGLEFAHNKGIVHRDIKPTNIMIDREGVLKILDFGIARVGDSGLTQLGTQMGTPNYMSPEQIEGRPIDRRSDIFAVGLVCYELLSFQQAFPGELMNRVWNAILQDAPRPLADWCPGLNPGLVAIVDRAIEKEPAKRYQTLASLAADVAKVATQITKSRRVSTDQSTVTIVTPPRGLPSGGRTPRPSTQRQQLSQRRAEAIEHHLQAARRAYDAGEWAAAVEACEQAALLDPDEPRALELLEQAREALDRRQIEDWLASARLCLAREETDHAAAYVRQVLELDPSSEAALSLQMGIDEGRAAAQRRADIIGTAIVRARADLARGQFESAIRAASEILGQDPTHPEAHEITRAALGAIRERRQREEEASRAEAAVAQQREAFAAGRWRDAIAALERFTPPHAIVDGAVAGLRAELVDLERRAKDEEARRRREHLEAEERRLEAEQRRQELDRWVARQLDLANAAMETHQFADAVEVLRHVEQVSPETAGVAEGLAAARAGQARVDAAASREREIADQLQRATAALDAGHLDEARGALEAVLALAPDQPEALAQQARVQAAIVVRDRQDAIDRGAQSAVEAARRLFEAGQHTAAMASLESFTPPHVLTTRAREALQAELSHIEGRRQEAAARERSDAAHGASERAREAAERRREEEQHQHEAAARALELERGRQEAECRRQEDERHALEQGTRRRIEAARAPGTTSRPRERIVSPAQIRSAYVILGGGALAVAILVAVVLFRQPPLSNTSESPAPTSVESPQNPATPAPSPQPALLSVSINASPWARVRIVAREPGRETRSGTTPLVVDLPEGDYTLEFQNELFQPLSVPLVVRQGRVLSVNVRMPGADIDRIVNDVLGPTQ